MVAQEPASAELLQRRVEALEQQCGALRADCDDYRRLAYDADLKLRTKLTQAEEAQRGAARAQGASLREEVARLERCLEEERAARTEQLEELAASLGELVQADLRKSAEQLRAESAATAAEHATRIEALEVSTELERSLQHVALTRLGDETARHAARHAEDSQRLLNALTRSNAQHAQATALLQGHWDRRENILAAVEKQGEALAAARAWQEDQELEWQKAERVAAALRSEIEAVAASVTEERTAWTAGQETLRREARAEATRQGLLCEEVGKEARLMQVSLITQLERKLEAGFAPIREENAAAQTAISNRCTTTEARTEALRAELETTLESRLRASEESLAALKEHTEKEVGAGLSTLREELGALATQAEAAAEKTAAELAASAEKTAAELAAAAEKVAAGFERSGERQDGLDAARVEGEQRLEAAIGAATEQSAAERLTLKQDLEQASATGAETKAAAAALSEETAALRTQVIRHIGAEGLSRRPPAGACWLFLGPGFRLAARWNRLVETVKTRKKRGKTEQKWARYGLKGVKEGS